MKLFWFLLGKLLSCPCVVNILIKLAKKRPYTHIMSADDKDVYMERYWLFNPYPKKDDKPKWQFPISIRLHKINEPDLDRHQHDHPWNCRTIILKGGYFEERANNWNFYDAGSTSKLRFGMDFHRIDMLMLNEPCWTFFITGKYRGTWGFLVDGRKIPHYEYLAQRKDKELCQ